MKPICSICGAFYVTPHRCTFVPPSNLAQVVLGSVTKEWRRGVIKRMAEGKRSA